MSYLVLARKYRPRNFREMVGQAHVVTALGNALVQKRLHHAYLFTGTRGVGKTTVSRILAKSLNCVGVDGQGDITAEPCGVCEACRAIDAGNFVDYTELDAASNRGVDEVQQLLEQAVYKPVQGRFKVFMIDEVHMLTNTAFNAMLKTLEEPPEYLKFVLATTDPQKVPVTVLSRCLQFNLRPMAPETVREHLAAVLGNEQIQAEPGALTLLSRAARGSMRDALSLTDQAIAFGAGQVQEATVRQMLGAVDRQQVFAIIEALAAGDGQAVVGLVEQARAVGLNAGSLLEDMAQVLQHMAVAQTVRTAEPPADADPDQRMEHQLAQQMARDETQLLYSICIHGRAELGLAPDEYAGLTMVLLRLLAFQPEGAEKKTPESGRLTKQALPAEASASSAGRAPGATAPPAVVQGLAPAPVPAAAPTLAKPVATSAAAAMPVRVPPAAPLVVGDRGQSGSTGPSMPVDVVVGRSMVQSPLMQQTRVLDTPYISVALDGQGAAPTPDSMASQPPEVPHPVPDRAEPPPVEQAAQTPPWREAAAPVVPVVPPGHAVPEIATLRPEQAHELDEHRAPEPAPLAIAATVELDQPSTSLDDEQDDLGPPSMPPWDELVELDAAPPVMAPAAKPLAPGAGAALQALPVRDAPQGGTPDPLPADDAPHPVLSVPVARASRDEVPTGQAKALPPLVPTEEGKFWHRVVAGLVGQEAINGFVRELALQSQLLQRDADAWHLACASGLLGSANTVERLQAALVAAGHAVQLKVRQAEVSDTPSLRNQHAQARRLNAARALLEADPFVQALQRDFAATIIDHSVKPL
ncbi:hypothetical protein CCO03_09735 [Comamonas serinivorans]|uniref:DNA-directed DNA polymerase n=1 Tax=Comamonas serinivorans TaxID=1082851 RepID=A0A1Y0EMP1_9BURK|nr:DNA polymerase III subunit gamma/tau [Comamonas serinivorans]ARU04925.1 hypothetical protein CCO03_09735 [Comamonas serinivorans]